MQRSPLAAQIALEDGEGRGRVGGGAACLWVVLEEGGVGGALLFEQHALVVAHDVHALDQRVRRVRRPERVVELEEGFDWQDCLHGGAKLLGLRRRHRVVRRHVTQQPRVVDLAFAVGVALSVVDEDDGGRACLVCGVALIGDELGDASEVLALAADADDGALLVGDAEEVAGALVEHAQSELVRVHHLPPAHLVRRTLVHADETVFVGHVAHNLPVHRPVFVRERPPLGLGVRFDKLLGAGPDQQVDHRLERLSEVEVVTVLLELLLDGGGHLGGHEVGVVGELLLPPQHALDHQLHVVGPLPHQLRLVHVPHQVQLRVAGILESGAVGCGDGEGAVDGDAVEGADAILRLCAGVEEALALGLLPGRDRRRRRSLVRLRPRGSGVCRLLVDAALVCDLGLLLHLVLLLRRVLLRLHVQQLLESLRLECAVLASHRGPFRVLDLARLFKVVCGKRRRRFLAEKLCYIATS
mmetsp:Transcript_35233/g.70455  ORF Transcript_35233/g.70455 Transcript_35233/m.70455 type:complete len:470 (+) Transcript_35233:223-1632(+)